MLTDRRGRSCRDALPNEARLREAASDPALLATEVAHYLVRRGVPFRQAHEIVGKVLREAEQEGKSIREMPMERLQKFSPAFGPSLSTALTLESALARRGRGAARLQALFAPRCRISKRVSPSSRRIHENASRENF